MCFGGRGTLVKSLFLFGKINKRQGILYLIHDLKRNTFPVKILQHRIANSTSHYQRISLWKNGKPLKAIADIKL